MISMQLAAHSDSIRSRGNGFEWLFGALFVGALLGCGDSGIPLKTIAGKITFNGKAPPKPGKIDFAPVEVAAGLPRRPGRAEFTEEGVFDVTTFEASDGLIPGKYSLNISCWREKPTLETRLSANYVPPTFNYEVEIKADAEEPVEVVVDVPVDVP